MKNKKLSKFIYYREDENVKLFLGDSFKILKMMESKSVDMIFADPPYFLSNDGISCRSGKMVSVNKAEWDKGLPATDKLLYNRKWIKLCREILKDNGTLWISGTFHNIYSIGVALELEGFSIINNITWQKTNPPPNISCRAFTHSTETILWARKSTNNNKGKHLFNYKLMKQINGGRQMKDVWEFSLTKPSEKKCGKHPTQKPLALLERILMACTNEGDIVLDPFNGSGTTGLACKKLKRRYVGIDNVEEYLLLSSNRLKTLKEEKESEKEF